MDSKPTFAKNAQLELQKKIVDYIKSNPQIQKDGYSDLTQINDIEMHFEELLKNEKAIPFESLRTLNDLSKANGQLVELTYMVQSMFNLELYAIAAIDTKLFEDEKYDEAIEVFKYHDTITSHHLQSNAEDEFNENIVSALGDRSIYYAIPIPNQNTWASQSKSVVGTKVEEKNSTGQEEIHHLTYKGVQISSDEDISSYGPKLQQLGLFNFEGNKSKSQYSYPCVLKYYNKDAASNPKLNQIVKVTGVLSYTFPDPQEEQQEEGQNEEVEYYESFDRNSFVYPERFIPRVHVLKSKTLRYKNIYANTLEKVSAGITSSSEVQRQLLIEALTKILGNDSLSAFYLLTSLISSVNLNKDERHYGNIFLNLLNTAEKLENGAKISQSLNDFLTSILVYSVSIPFTLKHLNTANVYPESNSTGKITFGELQLPKDTKHYIICDETGLVTGQLESKGISNLKNTNLFLKDLRVPFESEFFKGFVETDASGVILSDGKGLLQGDLQIKLEEDLESCAHKDVEFSFDMIHDEQFLAQIRKYLLESKNMALTVQLDEEVANSIQVDFVEKRKLQAKEHIIKKEEIINQESLERWIQLCRLNAASKLKEVATIEDYQEIKKLEENRIKRAMKAYKKQ